MKFNHIFESIDSLILVVNPSGSCCRQLGAAERAMHTIKGLTPQCVTLRYPSDGSSWPGAVSQQILTTVR